VRNRRTAGNRLNRGRDDDARGWLRARLSVLTEIGWGPRDAVACVVGIVGAVAILVNALFLQSGPHPAPLFKAALAPAPASDTTSTIAVAVPRARPPEPVSLPVPVPVKNEAPAAPRQPAEIMTDIQRELARRSFYDGPVDGVHGPKTDAAIRDFEQAAGMKPNLQASEPLLQAIVKSSVEAPKGAAQLTAAAGAAAQATPVHNDAIADMLAPSRRVIALQRALAQYGYGQLRPTGIVDGDTRAAIEKFERERKLPVTGQPSDRVARELAGLIGRPID
jgi:peptidoglycan hydrolase-like protein with peptidoglycan-binding domain